MPDDISNIFLVSPLQGSLPASLPALLQSIGLTHQHCLPEALPPDLPPGSLVLFYLNSLNTAELELVRSSIDAWNNLPPIALWIDTPSDSSIIAGLYALGVQSCFQASDPPTPSSFADQLRSTVHRHSFWQESIRALKQKEEKYRILVDNHTDLVVKTDHNGHFEFVSPSYCETFGRAEQELLGKSFLPLVHPDDREATSARMKELYEPPHTCRLEHRALTKDGWRWFAWSDKALVDAEGNITGIIGVGRDISLRKQANEALLQSERKWKGILQNTPQIAVALNTQGKIVFANRFFLELTGWTELEVLGLDWFDHFIPELNREEIRRVFSKGISTRETLKFSTYDNTILTRKGDIRTIAWSNVATRDLSGAIATITCLGVDLTERIQSERKHLETSKNLELALASEQLGFWEWDIANGCLVWNKRMQEIYGYGPELDSPTFDDWANRIHPDDREIAVQSAKAAASKKTNYESQFRLLLPDGTLRHIHSVGLPFLDENRRPYKLVGLNRDVTSEKKNQIHLQRINGFLKSIRSIGHLVTHERDPFRLIRKAVHILTEDRGFHHAWIILQDDRGNISDSAEASNLPSYDSLSSFLERNELPHCIKEAKKRLHLFLSSTPEDDCGSCPVCENGLPHGSMCAPLSCDDKIHGFLSVAVPPEAVDDPEERSLFIDVCSELAYALHMIEIAQHETESRLHLIEAKESAEAANRAKDEFLAVMSHEMRTPLNPILGFATLMLDECTDEHHRTYLQTIVESGEHQLELIDNILNFTRLDKGSIKPTLSRFPLLPLVETALREAGASAHGLALNLENGLEHFHSIPPGMIVVSERSMLLRILENLLGNACKYTREGSITLGVGSAVTEDIKRRMIRLEVTDTGMGIDEADQKRLFQPFSQVNSTYTRDFEGAGLGLAICRKLVTLLDGIIGVRSRPGTGSTFWVEIPMECELPEAITQDPSQTPTAYKRLFRNIRVLVVDDHQDNMLIAQSLITRMGGTAQGASNGPDALLLCEQFHYDAILMDLAMPGMSGFEVTRVLKSQPGPNQHTPVYAISADTTVGIAFRCADSGMQAYLPKPIRHTALYDLLQGIALTLPDVQPQPIGRKPSP